MYFDTFLLIFYKNTYLYKYLLYLHYQCLRYHRREFNVCMHVCMENLEKYLYRIKYFYERRVSSAVCIRATGVRPKNRKGTIYPARDPLFPRGRSTFVYNPRDDDSGVLCGST